MRHAWGYSLRALASAATRSVERLPVPLPIWPDSAAFDHRLRGTVDLFVDESGPREDRTFALGIVVIESRYADAARNVIDFTAAAIARDHPAVTSIAYSGEWKGRMLARSSASKKERRAIGRGELLADIGRQAVYARALSALQDMPGTRAIALTYRWTGAARGPNDQAGYRVRRAIQIALSALTFQVLDVRHAYIDDGHTGHYSAGIAEYASTTGFGAIPHEFVDSTKDRRIQLADLIAFAAHTARFPGGSRVFPSAHTWLGGFAGPRLIRAGTSVDHHVTEP